MFRLRQADCLASLIVSPETLLGPMQEHAQIVAIDAEFTANIVFLLFFQEDRAKKLAIFVAQQCQNFAYLFPRLLGHQETFEIN